MEIKVASINMSWVLKYQNNIYPSVFDSANAAREFLKHNRRMIVQYFNGE